MGSVFIRHHSSRYDRLCGWICVFKKDFTACSFGISTLYWQHIYTCTKQLGSKVRGGGALFVLLSCLISVGFKDTRRSGLSERRVRWLLRQCRCSCPHALTVKPSLACYSSWPSSTQSHMCVHFGDNEGPHFKTPWTLKTALRACPACYYLNACALSVRWRLLVECNFFLQSLICTPYP